MRKGSFIAGVVLLALLVALVILQGSFNLDWLTQGSSGDVYLFWALSTVVFLLTVLVGFLVFRSGVKLYVERRRNLEGSRIRTKLVVGAVMLSMLPIFFMVLWSVNVLNLNLDKWFSRPAEKIRLNLIEVGESLIRDAEERARAQAQWLASLDRMEAYMAAGGSPPAEFEKLCDENHIVHAFIERSDASRLPVCGAAAASPVRKEFVSRAIIRPADTLRGELVLQTRMPADVERKQREIQAQIDEYDQLGFKKKETRAFYINILALITLFSLCVAVWSALFVARQIGVPISALLTAAGEVRGGTLNYRIQVGAVDEMASLVRAFNEMTAALDTNSRELERRGRFVETILESIPTGVLSVTSDGKVQRVNRALKDIFAADIVERAAVLEDLFSREDAAEIRYLMKRARRLGVASGQMEFRHGAKTLHLAATVAALEDRVTSGFVIVLEDTSELLRAQKAVAWHEVARRIAHEIKNPLTPIALSAQRIERQVEKLSGSADALRIIRQCAGTIGAEVESVKTLVDEFTEFARFPAAQPASADLNEVVESALSAFEGRLDGIRVDKQLADGLPPVHIDREQFKRVVVNLVDNAAEAMHDSLVKVLYIRTQSNVDGVELVVADTGHGVSPEDKEKLFLPYFSTKGRGTGLGLAIVNHILADHHAHIRVEDNRPAGARFVVEIPGEAAA